MFPIGLGALEQGYDQAALGYWQRKQLEQGNAADIALGKMFQDMAGGGMPSGPPPMPMAPPMMGGGGPPGAGSPMMPPGGAGPAPGGSAGYPRMPYSPVQGPPGAPMQLGPGAMTGPSSPMGGPPGMPSGPPGAVPLPRPDPRTAGPPPGFINPSSVNGQPQNLTGPIIPPGGMGPQPGGGGPGAGPAGPPRPAGPAPPSPGTYGQDFIRRTPPMGMPGSPGAMPRLGTMGWEDLARRITSANPGAPPEVIAQAMTKAMPFMTAQAQQDWRSIELQLQYERNQLYGESIHQRPAIAGMRPEVQLLDKWWETHPDGTPEQAAEFLRSTKGGAGSRETPAQTALKKFLQENPEATAQDIQDFTNKPQFLKQDKSLTAAAERQRAGIEGAAERQRAGAAATGERQQIGIKAAKEKQKTGIEAAGERQQTGIAAAKERQQTGIAAAGDRQQIGIEAKQAPIRKQAESVSTQIDSIVNDIAESQKGGPAVTGVQGRLQRWYEWGGGLIGQTDETRATVFESKVRALQAQIPRLLAGVGRISAEERAHIDQIVRGLGTFTDPQAAIDSLNYLKEIIRSRTAGEPPAGSGGAASPGGKKPARASQQPVEAPPASMLREDMERDIKYPDGSVHTWILRNGEPVEVRGGGQGAGPFDQPPPPAGEGPEKHTKNINPTMKAGRDAVVDYFMRASERTTESLLNIVKDPISLVGTTTFGGANPGPVVLRSLLRSGKSLQAIGEEFGVSAPAALKWLRKYGLDAVGKPGAKSKIDDEKLKELVLATTDKRGAAAIQEGIKSWRQVGKELGVSANAAHQRAVKLGLIPGRSE